MPVIDTSNCNSWLNRLINPDCPGVFASDLDLAIYKAADGNLQLYQQAKAKSDGEQDRLDAIHTSDQLKTLGDSVTNIGGKVALGVGVSTGTILVVAAFAAFAYFKLEKAG